MIADIFILVNEQKTEQIREWDYGDYEGKRTAEIKKIREAKGLDKDAPWCIWTKGCEGGESPEQVSERCDSEY